MTNYFPAQRYVKPLAGKTELQVFGDLFNRYGLVEPRYIIPLPVVNENSRYGFHLEKGSEEIGGVAAHEHIRVTGDLQFLVKPFQVLEFDGRSEDHLHVFEQFDVGFDVFDLVFAMVAEGVENNEYRGFLFFQVVLSKRRTVAYFREFEGGDGWESFVNGRRIRLGNAEQAQANGRNK